MAGASVNDDLAGVVLRTGPGVNAWKPGDEVVTDDALIDASAGTAALNGVPVRVGQAASGDLGQEAGALNRV